MCCNIYVLHGTGVYSTGKEQWICSVVVVRCCKCIVVKCIAYVLMVIQPFQPFFHFQRTEMCELSYSRLLCFAGTGQRCMRSLIYTSREVLGACGKAGPRTFKEQLWSIWEVSSQRYETGPAVLWLSIDRLYWLRSLFSDLTTYDSVKRYLLRNTHLTDNWVCHFFARLVN